MVTVPQKVVRLERCRITEVPLYPCMLCVSSVDDDSEDDDWDNDGDNGGGGGGWKKADRQSYHSSEGVCLCVCVHTYACCCLVC